MPARPSKKKKLEDISGGRSIYAWDEGLVTIWVKRPHGVYRFDRIFLTLDDTGAVIRQKIRDFYKSDKWIIKNLNAGNYTLNICLDAMVDDAEALRAKYDDLRCVELNLNIFS